MAEQDTPAESADDAQGDRDRDRVEDGAEDRADSARAGLGAAMSGSPLGALAEADGPPGRALLGAMGGVRGILETVLPGLVFIVLYTITRNVPLSLGCSVGLAVLFTLVRVIRGGKRAQAVAGLIGVGISAILALITGKPQDNYVPGFFIDGGYGAALLISVLIGWPLIGLVVGYLVGDGTKWRKDRRRFWVLQLITVCWIVLFVARLAVQLPLYFADNVTGLGAARLLMGVPLYAPLLLLTWLMIRTIYDLSSITRDTDKD